MAVPTAAKQPTQSILVKNVPIPSPTAFQSVCSSAVLIVEKIPLNPSDNACPALAQSRFFIKPSIASAIAWPNSAQSNVSTKVYANSITVLSPSAKVLPTSFQSVAAMKPFKNVAMLFAIFLDVSLIFSHGIFSSASFNFRPKISPISVKSAFSQASLTIFAKSAIPVSIVSVVNILPAPTPVPPPPPPPEPPPPEESSSSSLLTSSKPSNVRFNFSAAVLALSAEEAVLPRLAA